MGNDKRPLRPLMPLIKGTAPETGSPHDLRPPSSDLSSSSAARFDPLRQGAYTSDSRGSFGPLTRGSVSSDVGYPGTTELSLPQGPEARKTDSVQEKKERDKIKIPKGTTDNNSVMKYLVEKLKIALPYKSETSARLMAMKILWGYDYERSKNSLAKKDSVDPGRKKNFPASKWEVLLTPYDRENSAYYSQTWNKARTDLNRMARNRTNVGGGQIEMETDENSRFVQSPASSSMEAPYPSMYTVPDHMSYSGEPAGFPSSEVSLTFGTDFFPPAVLKGLHDIGEPEESLYMSLDGNNIFSQDGAANFSGRTYRPVPKGITTNARIEERLKKDMRAANPRRSEADIEREVKRIKEGFRFTAKKDTKNSRDKNKPERRINTFKNQGKLLTADELETLAPGHYKLWYETKNKLIKEEIERTNAGESQIEGGTDDTSHLIEPSVSSSIEVPNDASTQMSPDSIAYPGGHGGLPGRDVPATHNAFPNDDPFSTGDFASPFSMGNSPASMYMSPDGSMDAQGGRAGFPDMMGGFPASMDMSPGGSMVAQGGRAGLPGMMGGFPASMDMSLDGGMNLQGGRAGLPGMMGDSPASMYMSPDGSMDAQGGLAGFPDMMGGFPASMDMSPGGSMVAQGGPAGLPDMLGDSPVSMYMSLDGGMNLQGEAAGFSGMGGSQASMDMSPDGSMVAQGGRAGLPGMMGDSPVSMYMSPDGGMNLQSEAAGFSGMGDSQALNANSHSSLAGFQGYDGHYNNASGQDAYTQAALMTLRGLYSPSYPGANSDYPQEDQK